MGAKSLVLRGKKVKTSGGLTHDALMRNKRGKIVSKRQSALGKQRYRQIEHWTEAVMAAREALHTKGFVAINGKTLQGKALYVKAKSLRATSATASSAAAFAAATLPASPGPRAAETPQAAEPTA